MISIIIPTYNSSKTLKRTLESVINQTYRLFQCIVVDDRSSENIHEIFKNIVTDDNRFEFQSRANNELNGANVCRNQGLHSSKFNLIIFLDSDDILEPFCLEERIRAVNLNPNNDAWIFNTGIFYDKKVKLFTRYSKNPLRGFLMGSYPWQTMSPIWKKDFLISINGFNENFPRLQDVELHSRALLFKEFRYKYFFFNKIDSLYFISENSNLTNEKLKKRIEGYLMFIKEILLNTCEPSDIRALKRTLFLLINEKSLLDNDAEYIQSIQELKTKLDLRKIDHLRIKIFNKYSKNIKSKLFFEMIFFNRYSWVYFFNKTIFNLIHKVFI